MTNSIKVGVEFNTSHRNSSGTFINSNEVTYSNNLLFPKFIFPFQRLNQKNLITKQSFINTNISLINRIDFFNQQIFNTGFGYNFTNSEKHLWSLKIFNFDYHRLYNRSASFDQTLARKSFPALFIQYGAGYGFQRKLQPGTCESEKPEAHHEFKSQCRRVRIDLGDFKTGEP